MLKRRNITIAVREFLSMDQERKRSRFKQRICRLIEISLLKKLECLKLKGCQLKPVQKASHIPKQIDKLSERLNVLQRDIHSWLAQIPNLPSDDVLVGKDETDNKLIRLVGTPTKFNFDPLDHVELGEKHGLDFDKAGKISGSRFSICHGKIARLHRALGNFMLDLQTSQNGYKEYSVPVVVKRGYVWDRPVTKIRRRFFGVFKGGTKEGNKLL